MQLDWLWAVLGPIFVFGMVVFVHELGHFLAAKATGVYAPRFSVGFGPALWRRRWGETEYVLAALPLGGYVRMASRQDEEIAFLEGGSEEGAAAARASVGDRPSGKDWDPAALKPFGPLPVPEHRWFESKSLAQRLLILIAGVAMNVLLALVVTIGLLWSTGRLVIETSVVGAVAPLPSAPDLPARLLPGDTIRAVDGRPVRTWNDIVQAIGGGRGDTVRLTTHRGSVAVALGAAGSGREQLAEAIDFYVRPVIDSVIPGKPAARAGLLPGDSIIAANDKRVRSFADMVDVVSASAGVPLALTVARGGDVRRVEVLPETATVRDRHSGELRKAGAIGVAAPSVETSREPIGFGEAAANGWATTWRMGGAIVDVVHKLITREVPVSELAGPIGIVRLSASAARSGLEALLGLLAFISINVAVLNLLPIPILDGGQILLNVVESARGAAFSARTREYILRFGLLAIALLFVVVMFNDIKRLWVDHIAGLFGIG